jgi:hypothetical protein
VAGRSRSSFNKRQKERSRQDKAREKAERKQQRKLEKQSGGGESNIEFGHNDMGPLEMMDDVDSDLEADAVSSDD